MVQSSGNLLVSEDTSGCIGAGCGGFSSGNGSNNGSPRSPFSLGQSTGSW